MGATTSAPPPPNLSELDPEEQRTLLRNVQLMSSRNPAQPGRFLFADFEATHAAMSPRLRYALWSALAAGDARESLGLDAVVCVVVPLRHSPLSLAAAQAHLLLCSSQQQATGAELAEDAATWLASLGKPAPPTADVARVLATAACTAWLVDLRELEPLPTLSEGSSSLLQPAHVRFLSRALPAEQRREWRLLYTTGRDGTSFTRLVGLTAQRTPVLVVVRDKAGAVFGGFASEPLEVSPQFGGGYGSFLFALHPGAPALYQASGSNANLVYLNVGMEQLPNGLAFGGSLDARFFGLWLRSDLETGRCDGPCITYGGSPCLASSAEFAVDDVEIWAVEDDPPPPSEEDQAAARGENALTAAGVLSSKHEETRAFLALAGRVQHSAALAPPPAATDE